MKNKDWHHWPLPADPITDDYVCYVVRVPNKREYITAFYDAWHTLTKWLSWEKRGDTSAAAAAELFRRFVPSPIACDIADEIDGDGNMSITINLTTDCKCGSCAGGSTVVNCGDDQIINDGTPITYVPMPDTDDPNNINTPDNGFDPVTETPPDDFPDWVTFINNQCLYANYGVDQYIKAIEAIRKVENAAGLLGTIISILLFLLPGPFKKAKIVSWIVEAAAWVLAFFAVSDRTLDILELVSGGLEENKETAVCLLYRYWATEEAALTLGDYLKEWYRTFPEALEYPEEILDKVDELITLIFRLDIFQSVLEWAADKVPADYVPSVNCDNCDPNTLDLGGGWLAVPMLFNGTFVPLNTSGESAHEVYSTSGSAFITKCLAASASSVPNYRVHFSAPLAEGLYVYGMILDTFNPVNVETTGILDSGTVAGKIKVQSCTNALFTPTITIRMVRDVWMTQFTTDTGLTLNMGGTCPLNVYLAPAAGEYHLGLADVADLAGIVQSEHKLWLICREDDLGA